MRIFVATAMVGGLPAVSNALPIPKTLQPLQNSINTGTLSCVPLPVLWWRRICAGSPFHSHTIIDARTSLCTIGKQSCWKNRLASTTRGHAKMNARGGLRDTASTRGLHLDRFKVSGSWDGGERRDWCYTSGPLQPL